MKGRLKAFKKNISNHHVLSWLMISVTMIYVYFVIFFKFDDWLMWIYMIFIVPLFIGLYVILNEEKKNHTAFIWDYKNGLFTFFGVLLTYALTKEFQISAVIGSSFMGFLGYILFKKYSIGIYAGSFAGMVSSYLFNYYEVITISFIMGVLFVFFQNAFKGLGGKLGTTAFISTIIVSILFQKDFLIVTNDLHFMRLAMVSIFGAIIPFMIQHHLKQSGVLASSLSSLIYAIIVIYLIKDYLTCAVVFFSASFIGMSSKNRLPNIIYLMIAGLIHAYLFHVYFEHYNGLGGKLGLMALTSVIITLGIKHGFIWTKTHFKIKRS